MREQPTQFKTGVTRKRMSVFAAIFITAALAAASVFALVTQPLYKPPPFEAGAVTGVPEPPTSFQYGEIDALGKFKFLLAGTMYQQQDGSLMLYFTNPAGNEAYLMCEVVDPNGKILYKSGLLRLGEYVASLYPTMKLENKAIDIKVNIYALEPERFHSIGTVTLNNILHPY